MDEKENLQQKLDQALAEVESLKRENAALRKALSLSNRPTEDGHAAPDLDTPVSSAVLNNDDKIKIFRSLFRVREDVYATRWESSKGITGYSPVHFHNEDTKVCRRSREGCEKLGEKKYLPLTDEVLRDHLMGRHVIGAYPLMKDDRCFFLALDFDKKDWNKDVQAFLGICNEKGIPAYPERSRSGKGAHVWFFFASAVPAQKARTLGAQLLSSAAEHRHQIGFESYDRMFPSQDLLPKGGFGSLIALPLQRNVREIGNSIFVTDSLKPIADQWQLLAEIKRLSEDELDRVIKSL